MNVPDLCLEFHIDDLNSNRDIYVQKLKVKKMLVIYHFSGLTLML